MEDKNNNLINKLEQIEPKNIQIDSHKESLKRVLLDWKYGNRKKGLSSFPVFFPRKLALSISGIAIVLLLFFAIDIIRGPQLTLADIKNIALKNPEVKELISAGNEIQDVKIIDNKAYVLIAQTKNEDTRESSPTQKIEKQDKGTTSILAEISIKEKEVVAIRQITVQAPTLTEQEKEKAKDIFEKTKLAEDKSSLGSIEITEIIPAPISASQLEIVQKNGIIEVSPKEQKVKIIYQQNSQQNEEEVNVTNETIESTSGTIKATGTIEQETTEKKIKEQH